MNRIYFWSVVSQSWSYLFQTDAESLDEIRDSRIMNQRRILLPGYCYCLVRVKRVTNTTPTSNSVLKNARKNEKIKNKLLTKNWQEP